MGWFAETLLCFFGLAIACAMVEPPADWHGGEDRRPSDSTPVCYKSLATAIIPAALLGGAVSAVSFLAQTTGANSPANVTVLVATLTAAEAGGCALASRLPHATPRDQIQLPSWIDPVHERGGHAGDLPLVALVLAFLSGVAQPLRAAVIQRLASDSIRARAVSAAMACDMAVSTIVLPLAGFWRSHRRLVPPHS